VPSGPYLVLPIFGPSSVRDAAGFGVESSGDLVSRLNDIPTRNMLYTLRAVETRANLLRASAMLEGAALDKYSFTRDVYLQRRQSQIDDLIDAGSGLGNGNGKGAK
jgi:phospholipid-binding lipoprotein MlaA